MPSKTFGKVNERALHFEKLESRQLLATGDALHLDGVDDYVSVPHHSALFPREEITVEAWVLSEGTGRGICRGIIGGASQTSYRLELCTNRIRFSPYLNGTSGNTTITPNVWTHLAATWDRGGSLKYYVNGDLEFSGSAGTLRPTATGPLSIGRFQNGFFAGHLSEVRLWDVARTQDQIRHTMHLQLDEARPGLVASWHFANDMSDSVGNHDGVAQGGAARTGLFPPQTPDPPAPTRPNVTPIDLDFGSLNDPVYGASTVYVPDRNEALVLGGARRTGLFSPTDFFSSTKRIDLATGDSSDLGSLVIPVAHAATTFVEHHEWSDGGRAFLFGGQNSSGSVASIQIVSESNGLMRVSTTELPQPTTGMTAIYHPKSQKIYLFGGDTDTGQQSNVLIFDPLTEAFETSSIQLPESRSFMAGSYSSSTGDMYLFGGNPANGRGSETIFRVSLTGTANSAVVTTLHTRLQDALYGLSATEDSRTGLIYLVGGRTPTIDVFDPVTNQLWTMPVEYRPSDQVAYAGQFFFTGAIYSSSNRHLVTIGGTAPMGNPNSFGAGSSRIVRIPVGNGPTIPLGRWDFPARIPLSNGTAILSVDGDDDRVLFGTGSQGAFWYDQDATLQQYTPGQLVGRLGVTSQAVNDVEYASDSNTVYLATGNQGIVVDRNGSISKTGKDQFGTNTILSVDATGPLLAGTRGDGVQQKFAVIGGGESWRRYLPERHVPVIARRGVQNEFWVLAGIPFEESIVEVTLWRINTSRAIPLVTNYGRPTLDGNAQHQNGRLTDLVFDPNADWWISSTEGIVHIRAADNLNTNQANLFRTENEVGNHATTADVDAEGRVWFSLEDSAFDGYSGGLSAYQSDNGSIRAQDYSWLDAPVGTSRSVGGLWDSSFAHVEAVDERVWATRSGDSGEIVTIAQRWQQLDEANNLDDKVINRIWTVRGRVFMAAENSLHVLMPDGETWDNRFDINVNAVFGDRQGRIWVGTDDGLRIYTADGWDMLENFYGDPATGKKVQAITQESDGRIWIGTDQGLILLTNDYFRPVLTTVNFDLPSNNITSLAVANGLYVGTDNGLAVMRRGAISRLSKSDGLSDKSIVDLQPLDQSLGIAVSTAKGVDLVPYNPKFAIQNLSNGENLPLSRDEQGRLWAGSSVLNGDQWQNYFWTNSGLRSSNISDNSADLADRIWFSHAPDTGVSVRGSYLPPLADSVPIVNSIHPRFGTSGDVIEVRGSGFGTSRSDLRVTVGGVAVQIQNVEEDVIQVRLGDTNVTGAVSVTKGKRTSVKTDHPNGGPLFCAVPTINAFTPTGGNVGVEVTVVGSNFDPDVELHMGNVHRSPSYQSPTGVRTWVQTGDTDGKIRLRNACGESATAESDESFNKLQPNIQQLVMNQGMRSYGLVQDKPTLFSYYVGLNDDQRTTGGFNDVVEIDQVEITISSLLSGQTMKITRSGINDPADNFTDDSIDRVKLSSFTIPTRKGALTLEDLIDLDNSLNFEAIYPKFSGPVSINTRFLRNNSIVLDDVPTHEMTAHFGVNNRLEMLLVPIMPDGSTHATFQSMRERVDGGLQHLKERIYPFGTVDVTWGNRIFTDDEQDINDALDLYHMSHQLDEERERQGMDRAIVMGVVHRSIADGTGQAFWPDLSNLLNGAVLNHLDVLCDAADVTLSALTFGIHEAAGCDLTIPLYTGWINEGSTNEFSRIIGHEMGHTLGLVKPWADNGDVENFSHSENDELDDGECSDGTDFDFDLSLYRQPGVVEPIVDPISGEQFRPQPGGSQFTDRAKSIMSYACMRQNENVFFEPTDLDNMLLEVFPFIGPPLPPPPPPPVFATKDGGEVDPVPAQPQAAHEDARIRVSGSIEQVGTFRGEIAQVTLLDGDGSLSLSFQSDLQVLQLDSSGRILSQIGVNPFVTNEVDVTKPQLFATTMVRQHGLARIELRRGDRLLDSISIGTREPTVQITQPQGGVFDQGTLNVRWNAADPDGDKLRFHLDYSQDDGLSWMPLGSTYDRAIELAFEELPASTSARLRVTASDGFNASDSVSERFTVANHAPTATISSPSADDVLMEGKPIHFSAVGFDLEDGQLPDSHMVWVSDRDGFLGFGQHFSRMLQPGPHAITLQATDSNLVNTVATVSVEVIGDYDRDGISDTKELAIEMNPLLQVDAFTDEDNDGLSRRVEIHRALNPLSNDSDGDGRGDSSELVAGTHPGIADLQLIADELKVQPELISARLDLSHDLPLHQLQITVTSRAIVDWNVTSDVPWLTPLTVTGQTPDGLVVRIEAYLLPDGVHQSGLNFYSQELEQQVFLPIEVHITNNDAYFDINREALDVSVGTVYTEQNYNYRLDINRDGVIDGEDVTLFESSVGFGPADLNRDGRADEDDVTLLCRAYGTNNPSLDLNGDGAIDFLDLGVLIQQHFGTSFGDANLDGIFNSGDLILVFSSGEYEDNLLGNSTWSEGDWNCDGEFNSTDVIVAFGNGGYVNAATVGNQMIYDHDLLAFALDSFPQEKIEDAREFAHRDLIQDPQSVPHKRRPNRLQRLDQIHDLIFADKEFAKTQFTVEDWVERRLLSSYSLRGFDATEMWYF